MGLQLSRDDATDNVHGEEPRLPAPRIEKGDKAESDGKDDNAIHEATNEHGGILTAIPLPNDVLLGRGRPLQGHAGMQEIND